MEFILKPFRAAKINFRIEFIGLIMGL